MSISILPAARADILHQFHYYLIEKDAEDAATRFLSAVQRSINEIEQHPEAGAPKLLRNPALQGLRTWPVEGVPSMRVYYLFQDHTVRVVRVLHGRRDIGFLLDQEAGSF